MENDFRNSRENPPPLWKAALNFFVAPSSHLRRCPAPSHCLAAPPYPSSLLAFNVIIVVAPPPSPTTTFLHFHKSKKNLTFHRYILARVIVEL